jgi:hypothetical protein
MAQLTMRKYTRAFNAHASEKTAAESDVGLSGGEKLVSYFLR